ncbi:hypothetical protein ACWGII_06260 [Streptomyces sp. NPDC054855]
MAQDSPARARICRNCDGFASVKVTFGGRDASGNRRLITARCPACQGTGIARRTARITAVAHV